ncbi:MAG: hypothetical protein QXP63_03375 [Conexivisphaerales archaeon]
MEYDKDNPVDIAVDSSRYSIGVNGSGRTVRRGWVKLHISCESLQHRGNR